MNETLLLEIHLTSYAEYLIVDYSKVSATMKVYVIHQDYIIFDDSYLPTILQICRARSLNVGRRALDPTTQTHRTWKIVDIFSSFEAASQAAKDLCNSQAEPRGYSTTMPLFDLYSCWGVTENGKAVMMNTIVEKEVI